MAILALLFFYYSILKVHFIFKNCSFWKQWVILHATGISNPKWNYLMVSNIFYYNRGNVSLIFMFEHHILYYQHVCPTERFSLKWTRVSKHTCLSHSLVNWFQLLPIAYLNILAWFSKLSLIIYPTCLGQTYS